MKLPDLIANIEAGFDYPDQIDEEMTREKLNICLDGLIPRLDALSSTYSAGRLLARGVTVCILGLPNAGKSSLINALAGREWRHCHGPGGHDAGRFKRGTGIKRRYIPYFGYCRPAL